MKCIRLLSSSLSLFYTYEEGKKVEINIYSLKQNTEEISGDYPECCKNFG